MTLYSTKKMREQDQQIASVALAVEALEILLVEKGLLKDNEVLDKIKSLAAAKVLDVELRLSQPIRPPKQV